MAKTVSPDQKELIRYAEWLRLNLRHVMALKKMDRTDPRHRAHCQPDAPTPDRERSTRLRLYEMSQSQLDNEYPGKW